MMRFSPSIPGAGIDGEKRITGAGIDGEKRIGGWGRAVIRGNARTCSWRSRRQYPGVRRP